MEMAAAKATAPMITPSTSQGGELDAGREVTVIESAPVVADSPFESRTVTVMV